MKSRVDTYIKKPIKQLEKASAEGKKFIPRQKLALYKKEISIEKYDIEEVKCVQVVIGYIVNNKSDELLLSLQGYGKLLNNPLVYAGFLIHMFIEDIDNSILCHVRKLSKDIKKIINKPSVLVSSNLSDKEIEMLSMYHVWKKGGIGI